MAIAGRPNYESDAPAPAVGGALELQCWPTQRTHEVPLRPGFNAQAMPASPDLRYDPSLTLDAIVVTGSHIRRVDSETASPVLMAAQENLGDLKLYRVPEAVTLQAQGQKQIAMLSKPDVAFEKYYGLIFDPYAFGDEKSDHPLMTTLRGKNLEKNGLGLPLPQGSVQIFESSPSGVLWLGESDLADIAIGEEVELAVGSAADISMRGVRVRETQDGNNNYHHWQLTISNARDQVIRSEVKIPFHLQRKGPQMQAKNGETIWKTLVPANGKASVDFVIVQSR
jgi:hypothetical protein